MTPLRYGDVAVAVETVKNRYLEEERASSSLEINSGLCVDFSEDVQKQLNIQTEGEGFYLWDIDNFRDFETEEWYGESVEMELNTVPPFQISWKDMNDIPFGHHRWITFKKRHYDAECVEGVDNLFDLPFFTRYVNRYRK